MHAEAARGLGDVEIRLGQHLVDALPLQGLDGAGPVGEFHLGVAFGKAEGGLDVVGVGGLGEVMAGAELHRFHRRGDAREAGQHHDAHVGVAGMQLLHAGQARGLALELEVHDRVAGLMQGQQVFHAGQAVGMQHAVAAALERARQGPGEGFVVLHDQQQAFIVHGECVRWVAARLPTAAAGC